MGMAWIQDDERPGGIGRTERERVFWERVASGRPYGAPNRSSRRRSRARAHAQARWQEGREGGQARRGQGHEEGRARRSTRAIEDAAPAEGIWESLEVAVIALLTVVVFGLGWATLELEVLDDPSGYQVAAMDPGVGPRAGATRPRMESAEWKVRGTR